MILCGYKMIDNFRKNMFANMLAPQNMFRGASNILMNKDKGNFTQFRCIQGWGEFKNELELFNS